MSVKIDVVPPIPNARVKVAAAVNTGDSRNCRKVYRIVPSGSLIVESFKDYETMDGKFHKRCRIRQESTSRRRQDGQVLRL